MLPELGHFALIVALTIALVGAVLPIAGAARGHGPWMALARPAAQAQFVFVAITFFALMASFAQGDFSLVNVASHSNSELPMAYRLAATWGSHEGSMLLWVFMLAAWAGAVSVFGRRLPADMLARVLGVMSFVAAGQLLFIVLTSNPFARLVPPALEGRDLNPLLQDPGMVLHPPMLYMGYVGFAVAFAFAVAALLGGRLDAAWARWSRPWTTAAWCFLTLGIALGSWWAYYELGWGGWWFWDPVENASFMPWLAGTALIHSLAVADKRGAFKAWTVLLAIAAFSLSLMGTFLVRSGVLTSVHAFATDPARGAFILAFLAVVVGGSLALFAWRAGAVGWAGRFDRLSRESLLLFNNVLLASVTGAVLLGTLYPLALDALGFSKISVGAPYFEAVFVPLMAPLVLLMGVAPLARWKSATPAELGARLKWAAIFSAAAAAAPALLGGRFSVGVAVGVALAAWVFSSTAALLWQTGRRAHGGRGGLHALRQAPRHFWGMVLAHAGVGVFIVGVTMVRGFESERDVRMTLGDHVELAGHRFTLTALAETTGPNYVALRADVRVQPVAGGPGEAFTMQPEKRLYKVRQMPMTEAAIDTGLTRDLYVALGEALDDRTWTLRVQHKPFVTWIWGGALLMALGGALAAGDRRYRLRGREAPAPEPLPAAEARPAVPGAEPVMANMANVANVSTAARALP